MRDELEDNQEVYHSLTYEYWCELMSIIKVKDNRKIKATKIKNIYFVKSVAHSYRNTSVRIPGKNKANTGVLHNSKGPNNKAPEHHGNQIHCVLYNKAVITERKYMPHSAGDCFGKRSEQKSIRY